MPPAWKTLKDDGPLPGDNAAPLKASGSSRGCDSGVTFIDSSKSLDAALDDDDMQAPNSQRSARARSLNFPMRLLKRPRGKRPSVTAISLITLYNRLQTSSVVVIDCRSAADFAAGHIRGAFHCEHGRRSRHKSVDDVLKAHAHCPVAQKLENREMMEIVVIGSNRTSSSLFNCIDGGYRLAKLLLKEGKVFSAMFLAAGFHTFATKYPFMLTTSSESASSISTIASDEAIDATVDEDQVGTPTNSAASSVQYPNEIIAGFLFLGNFWQANNAQIIDDLGITHIINMGAITDDRNTFDHVTYLDVEIKDRETVDIRKEFAHTVAFIQQASQVEGARVLIHCVQGVSRSSTIVIWYLMLETKCTLSAAYSYVLRRRPLIFPNRGFMEQLMENEKELYGEESVLPQELDLLQHGLLPPMDRQGSELRPSIY